MIHDDERLDDLERDGLMLIQNPQKFCFGIDAVLLSSFAKAKEGDKVLDIGTGTGVIPILMSAKTKASSFTGIELQKDMADMAKRSVEYNGLDGKIEIIEDDVVRKMQDWDQDRFDVITCNPPYMADDGGLINLEESIALARHEITLSIEDVAKVSLKLLKTGGRLYLVHRPYRLADVITTLRKYKLEPKRLQMIHPYADKEANMFLLEARKGSKSFMTVEKPLIVYESAGKYTEETRCLY